MSPSGRMTVLLLKDLFVIFTVTGGALLKQFVLRGFVLVHVFNCRRCAQTRGEIHGHESPQQRRRNLDRLRNFPCVRVCGREKDRRFRCHAGPPSTRTTTYASTVSLRSDRKTRTSSSADIGCALICPGSTRVACSGCDGLTSSREHVTCHRPGCSFCSAS